MHIVKLPLKNKVLFFSFDRKENNQEQKMSEKVDNWINLSESIFPLESVEVTLENAIDPKYIFNDKRIYLPYSYKDEINKKDSIYYATKAEFGNLYDDFIAYHEIGHAVQHDLVNNGQVIDIKSSPSLNYLFNGAAVPNKINNFLQEIFKEAYADCYASLCLYKETKDMSVFDKASNVREKRYFEMKKELGNHYIHPNFNYASSKILGKLIQDYESSHGDVFQLSFLSDVEECLRNLIEKSVLKGCISTLVKELSTNDNFLNHFKKFSKEFKIKHNNPQMLSLLNSLKDDDPALFFNEFNYRSGNKAIISEQELIEIINNKEFKRKVDDNITLMDVCEIPYSAGLEDMLINKNINQLRKKYLFDNKNNISSSLIN